MEYTVQFLNNSNELGIVQKINYTRKQICEKQYFNATSIVIWATYNGTEGFKSATNVTLFITSTLPETTTTTTRSGKSYCYKNLISYNECVVEIWGCLENEVKYQFWKFEINRLTFVHNFM